MRQFKEGDLVRIKDTENVRSFSCYREAIGKVTTLTNIDYEGGSNHPESNKFSINFLLSDFELINDNKTNMSLLETFKLAFKAEPQKSFTKAGITNSDDTLTSEGKDIFLAWSLKTNGAQFKTEVVDVLLADQENK